MLAEPTPYEAAPPAEPPPGPASYEPAAHFEPATGQYEPATGQYDPAAHFEPATGQYEPAAGQYEPATGQYEPATGQYDPAAYPGWTSAGPASPQQWAGPGRAGGPKQRPPRQPISRTRLIAAAAGTAIVVVAVAIAAALSLSKHNSPSSSAPRGTSSAPASSTASAGAASRQAAAVNTLLASGAATRRSLTVPIRMATNCRHLPRDAASIRRVVNQRSAEFRNVQALSTGAMAKGGLVKADLLSALRNSLAADRAYLTWVRQQMNSGCTPTSQSSAYQAAQTADGQADAAKRSFVQVWNSVAARYRLPQKSPGDI
jgi:hypothetical protein